MDFVTIKKKLDELEVIKAKLKKSFIGLDDIIDKFINNITVWYVTPEIQTRPVIVNLWGMTGVGKTDLIRKFVKFAKFNDRFIEVQLDPTDDSYSSNKIQYHLENILEDVEIPGILLLDEIQRFRTIDDKGGEIRSNVKFNDIWMLLSDGKFESDSKNRREAFEILYDEYYQRDYEENYDENESEEPSDDEEKKQEEAALTSGKKKKNKKQRKYHMYYYNAKRLRKVLKLKEPVEEIMRWNIDKKIEVIKKQLSKNDTFEGGMYSKLLVVISGNLDEAYKMAHSVDEVDLDADIFHEFSKNISIIDIKKSLMARFKPEQIARFGNTHIIYPAFSKKNYEDIIKMKVLEVIKKAKDKTNVKITVDNSVYKTIYKNGVFPTQGVRPVLTTISSVFESSLPLFIYECKMAGLDEFKIYAKEKKLYVQIKDKIVEKEVYTPIEDIKKKKDRDFMALTAAHEAGHAVCYSILFKHAPLQLTCNTASVDSEGFSAHNKIQATVNSIKDQIIFVLAGSVAEEIIFGNGHKSSGGSSDIIDATYRASNFFRKYGFGDFSASIKSEDYDEHCVFDNRMQETSIEIENMLKECKSSAFKILHENLPFLKSVIVELFKKGEMSSQDFIKIAAQHGLNLKENKIDYTIVENYEGILGDFLNEKTLKTKKDGYYQLTK